MTDADAVTGTDQRQPEQFWVALDPSEQFGIGKLQVFQSGVDVSLAFGVQQSGQSKAINESLDFRGGHGFLLQIYQLDRDAALFEKTLAARVACEFLMPKIWTVGIWLDSAKRGSQG